MNTKEEIKHVLLVLLGVTIVILLDIPVVSSIMCVVIQWSAIIGFFSALADWKHDKKPLISIVAGGVVLFTIGTLNKTISTEILCIVFCWSAGVVYIYLIYKFEEYDKIKIMLSKIEIQVTSNENGKVEKIYVTLKKRDERYFYDIKPEYIVASMKYIENIITNTKNPAFYGYRYAIRIFRIGDNELFNWYVDN